MEGRVTVSALIDVDTPGSLGSQAAPGDTVGVCGRGGG